jgi:ribose 5-phosphate isomerase A
LSFDSAIKALSTDALRLVKDDYVLGLGSGRAATAFVKSLSPYIKTKNLNVRCVPTSLQIKLIAEKGGIPLIEADQVNHIDVVFDGADQIDAQKNLIKGGGGALLRENILISAAKKVVIMADTSKFVKNFNRSVPVEVHPLARNTATKFIEKLGGIPKLRSLDRGYPFITENGNVILDCDFGVIKNPKILAQKIKQIAGVIEVGIFTRKPDVIYKAKTNGKFDILK